MAVSCGQNAQRKFPPSYAGYECLPHTFAQQVECLRRWGVGRAYFKAILKKKKKKPPAPEQGLFLCLAARIKEGWVIPEFRANTCPSWLPLLIKQRQRKCCMSWVTSERNKILEGRAGVRKHSGEGLGKNSQGAEGVHPFFFFFFNSVLCCDDPSWFRAAEQDIVYQGRKVVWDYKTKLFGFVKTQPINMVGVHLYECLR